MKSLPSAIPSAVVFFSLLIGPAAVGTDSEDANDAYTGAAQVSPPTTLGTYVIDSLDSDWFRVSKGSCDTLLIKVSSTNSIIYDGQITVDVFDDDTPPKRIASVKTSDDPDSLSRLGTAVASLSYRARGKTAAYVRVYGGNLVNSFDTYSIQFTTVSINSEINRRIAKANKKIEKMTKRMKQVRTAKLRKSYKKRIKSFNRKIKVLKRGLCSE